MSHSQSRKKLHLRYQLCYLFIFLNLASIIEALRCKVPYEKIQENYCYLIVDDFPLHTSFHNFCYQDKRTSRVCLETKEEMIVLANYLYYIGFENGSQFWSAGHRWPGDMRFYWNYFGRARDLNYTNWAENEPSLRMGKNCLILTLQDGELVMSSESCYTQAVDICEQLLMDERYFDWFMARTDCRANNAELVAVETEQEMISLQNYIDSKGYSNGSTFATSGNSFRSSYPYAWESVNEKLKYKKWLPGELLPLSMSYLSLIYSDSELYMIRSSGYDQYYICEYYSLLDRILLQKSNLYLLIILCLLTSLFIGLLFLLKRKMESKGYKSIDGLIKPDLLSAEIYAI